MNPSFYATILLIAALVIWRRSRAMFRPIRGSGLRLLIPLLFILPSLALILNPKAYLEAWEWLAALGVGIVLSLPLIWTTNYERREDQQIYAVKNMGFIASFLGVLIVRFALRSYIEGLSQEQMSALFMIVAYGYILPWRLVSYYKFRKIYAQKPAVVE
ncbi:cytochrome c biogenesis protein CcdC [Cohnella endophytica]|uniref:Cytochrome c biogenesis protein CcdC n=1 Tax=Cohnella endophytica TaxID=2419778 RepID=A0A494XFS2_9BACL|nr:cytochrome c biogenesis protein CcdC [Cohnella endophytica]RKP47366.1 cytochrome c biogenesis protein CcdC [Cohnella endophytica]